MTIQETIDYGNYLLEKYGLQSNKFVTSLNWNISLEVKTNKHFGLCVYNERTIYINAHHIRLNTDYEVKRTVIHELAHALTPNNGHNRVWKMKFESLLNIELEVNEVVTNRFGKGKLPTAAEIKKRNNFTLDL